MKGRFSKQFGKQIDKLKDSKQKRAIGEAVKHIILADSLSDIPNIKKMKGDHSAYRMRIGNFRLGFFFRDEEVLVSTVLHRKDIYKSFP